MKIVRALTRAGNDEHLDLGTIERVIISTACKVHPRMLNLYLKADQDRDITKFSITRLRGVPGTTIQKLSGPGPYVNELELLPVPPNNGLSRRGKIVNP
jgi:hypothetical protein